MTKSRSTLRIGALFYARGYASREDYRRFRHEFLTALQQEQAELPGIPVEWHEAVNARNESESAATAKLANSGEHGETPEQGESIGASATSIGARPVPWPWVAAGALLLIAGVYYYSWSV